jgi:hypothetical protein
MIPIGALLDIGGKILDKVFPDPAQAEQAKLKLLEMQQNGELAKLNADVAEQHELTERLKAEMGSAMMSAWDIEVNNNYVELLGQWGMLIMSFYFGGRTLEKIIEMKAKNESKRTLQS